MEIRVLIAGLICWLLVSCNIGNSRPSDEKIKETVYNFVVENDRYRCPAKNGRKEYWLNVQFDSWNGVFKNSDTEYVAKIIIEYDNCWKKDKKEPMNFFFHKNTEGKWVMDKLTFDSADQFYSSPQALHEWYQTLSTKTVVLD